MDPAHMREFWDARAREDPYFFVDDRRVYGDPELAGFWSDGERDLDRLLAALGVRIEPGDELLELGCGVGRLTRVIARRARQVHALDISGEMIDRARRHHAGVNNVRWLVSDGRSLQPIADAGIDGLISHVVLQHIPDPRITLGYVEEMGRVLKPGGWAAFQISDDARIHRPRRGVRHQLHRARAAAGRGPRGQDDPAWLGSAVDLTEVRDVARRSGLVLDRVLGERTQFCLIRATRAGPDDGSRR